MMIFCMLVREGGSEEETVGLRGVVGGEFVGVSGEWGITICLVEEEDKDEGG